MKDNTCVKPLGAALRDNFKHAISETFYAAAGAISTAGIVYLKSLDGLSSNGNLKYLGYLGPVVLTANTYARLSEISTYAAEEKRAESFESTMAQALVNTGLYFTSGMLVATAPVAAYPVLGTFFACEFLLKGDNAPIDYIKEGIADILHLAHVGEVIDYIL